MSRILFVLFLVLTTAAWGQEDVRRKENFNVKKDLALEGYDPVSYFDGKPLEGKAAYSARYKGILYHFANPSNLAKFKASPAKYEPAYGGWCAYAMGETGDKVKIDPETYTVLDGKLYLFYNFWGNNTLKDWKKNEQKLKVAADRNWEKVLQ